MQWLLIDDDTDDQEIFLMALEMLKKNIECKTVNSGQEALQMLRAGSFIPSHIFIDFNMPRMNGIECLENIKDIEALKDSKVYMYSTTAESSFVNKAKALGAVDFFIKPTRVSEIRDILAGIFSSQYA